MRSVLVGWIMDLAAEQGLRRTTFYTTVMFLDIVLAKWWNIKPQILQCLAVALLCTAIKAHEVFNPLMASHLRFVEDDDETPATNAYKIDQAKRVVSKLMYMFNEVSINI